MSMLQKMKDGLPQESYKQRLMHANIEIFLLAPIINESLIDNIGHIFLEKFISQKISVH